jgi:hypothetical protein
VIAGRDEHGYDGAVDAALLLLERKGKQPAKRLRASLRWLTAANGHRMKWFVITLSVDVDKERQPMSTERRRTAMATAILGLLLVIAAVSAVKAEEQPGFTPTYRLWPRITSGYVASNAPFNNKTSNPANLDLTGIHSVYANTKALGWILGGKKGAAPDGSVFVAEFYKALPFVPNQVFLEDAKNFKFTAWMIKDSAKNADTGGWRWEAWVVDKDGKDAFFGGKALDAATQKAACVTCHTGFAKATDLVISSFSDTAHVKNLLDKLGGSMQGTMAATMSK